MRNADIGIPETHPPPLPPPPPPSAAVLYGAQYREVAYSDGDPPLDRSARVSCFYANE